LPIFKISVKQTPYRQIPDNPDFMFIKSKLGFIGTPQSAVDEFEGSIKDKRYVSMKAAERYGLANCLYEKE
jgi:hypothetical protein